MAPFSIDRPPADGATPDPRDRGHGSTLAGVLAAALAQLRDAASAGREGRRHDRAAALGDAMRLLDGLVSGLQLPVLDDRGFRVPGQVLRVMQLLLQATLTGKDAPLGLATEALRSVSESGTSTDAAVLDIH